MNIRNAFVGAAVAALMLRGAQAIGVGAHVAVAPHVVVEPHVVEVPHVVEPIYTGHAPIPKPRPYHTPVFVPVAPHSTVLYKCDPDKNKRHCG